MRDHEDIELYIVIGRPIAGNKYPYHFNAWRANDNNEHAGKDKENERQEQLYRQLCSQLFCSESARRPHGIRMNPKSLADTGAEPVCLHKEGDQISHLFQVRAMRKISQGFLS